MSNPRLRPVVALLCVLSLVLAACGDDDGGSAADPPVDDAPTGVLVDRGACDSDLPTYEIGTITPIDSPALSLGDDAKGLEAAVDAFNERGGVGDHCINLTVCDSKFDPNTELDCARQLVAAGVVATLSDTTPTNTAATKGVLEEAGIPRIGISPGGAPDLSSTVAYPLDAGTVGTTSMTVSGCVEDGHTKLAAIHRDAPNIGAFLDSLKPMVAAHGATLDTRIPVPVGTTDYQQFILAAEAADATCAIVLLGPAEALQLYLAASQLGSELDLSGPSASAETAKSLGDYATHVSFNSALPPATASEERWPVLADVIRDLGGAGLTKDTLLAGPMRSWLATYALVTVVERFGDADDVSSTAVTAALKAATAVDMHGLIPPWTPSAKASAVPAYSAISQPWNYIYGYDESGKVTVQDKLVNVLEESTGNVDYDQPADAG